MLKSLSDFLLVLLTKLFRSILTYDAMGRLTIITDSKRLYVLRVEAVCCLSNNAIKLSHERISIIQHDNGMH